MSARHCYCWSVWMVLFTQTVLHKHDLLKPHLRQTLSTSLDFPPAQLSSGTLSYVHWLPWCLWTPSSISSTPGSSWSLPGLPSLCHSLEKHSWQEAGAAAGLAYLLPISQGLLSLVTVHPEFFNPLFHICCPFFGCLRQRVTLVSVTLSWVKVEASTIPF